jgi:spore germination cell wall hydrolase CwlJ-like protein
VKSKWHVSSIIKYAFYENLGFSHVSMRNEEEAHMLATASNLWSQKARFADVGFITISASAFIAVLFIALISRVPTPANAAIIALPVAQQTATLSALPLKRTQLASMAEAGLADILEPNGDTPLISPEPLYDDMPASVAKQAKPKRQAIATVGDKDVTESPGTSPGTGTDMRALKSVVAQARGLPNAAMDAEGLCLAEAVYFESRGQPLVGQLAVAQVILHRVADKRFAKSVCGVVQERSRGAGGACQFSFVCDANSDVPNNSASWDEAKAIAKVALTGDVSDVTGGKALFFHALHAAPAWRLRMEKTATLGSHLFYRPR